MFETQRRPVPRNIPYGIPEVGWQIVLARVANHESYRTIAKEYGLKRNHTPFSTSLTKGWLIIAPVLVMLEPGFSCHGSHLPTTGMLVLPDQSYADFQRPDQPLYEKYGLRSGV